ncbi:MAG: transposase [Cyanobacteria bacterium J06633_2]
MHRAEIVAGQLVVVFQDECHLMWGDVCGYGWGKRSERIDVPITNERCRQTYYGALNLFTQTFSLHDYDTGNSESTIAFLKTLQQQYPNSRIAVIWDGASYHRSHAVQAYLDSVNQGLEESRWKLTCIRFAPNDPTQNPVEDVWLQGKRFIREFHRYCSSFRIVKQLFELVTHQQVFRFPKVFTYGSFL